MTAIRRPFASNAPFSEDNAIAKIPAAVAGATSMPSPAPIPSDLPAPSWDGFYVGGSVGMRISDADWNTTGIRAAPSAPDRVTATGHFGNASVRGGLYAGFNIQRGFWVYGLEGDVGSANNTERHLGIPGATPLGGPAVIYDPSLDSTRKIGRAHV